MKKNKIAVAVFAVIIAAASLAKAGGFDVDFDKGAFRAANFMEAVKVSGMPSGDAVSSIKPVPATALESAKTAANISVYALAAHGLQKLRREVLNMPGVSKEFVQLVSEEKTVVLYNENNVFLTTLVGDVQYVLLESNDKKLLEFLGKYRTELLQGGLEKGGKVKVCVTVAETAWKLIKEIWTAYEIYKEVCTWETNTPTPSTGNPGGSGGTYHNGQGGDSDYDVNKHLK